MLRKTGTMIMGIVFCIVLTAAAYAAAGGMSMTNETRQDAAPDTSTCPVSGEPVSKDTTITYTYNGTVYRFCCPACIDEFKKDPEKYIEKMKKRQNRDAR